MKSGFYVRLAKDGIVKNRTLYFPYILTCICMVMMYYILYYLGFSADLGNVRGSDMLQSFLQVGVNITAVFAVIFLYYTNSFLIRRRKKEFGLYHILGMGKRNLVRILIWENILTGAVSITAGIGLGIIFSKLAELAAVRILNGETGFGIYVSVRPVAASAGFFFIFFLLIMFRMVYYILRLRPVELIKSENVGEKPPKANWVFALIGAVLLGGAYYLAVNVIDPMSAIVLFFIAVVMVIIATYLLFIAGSVTLCRLLQKNKNYYYKTKHFISLSSMTYRMKRNGAGLASICILSTMLLVTVSSTVCLFAQVEDGVEKRYPYDICMNFYSADYSETQPYKKLTEEVLERYDEKAQNPEYFHYYMMAGLAQGNQIRMNQGYENAGVGEVESVRSIYMVTVDDYNRLSGEKMELSDEEILLYPLKTEFEWESLTIDGCGTWNVKMLDQQPFPAGASQADAMGAWFIVVRDMSVMEQIETYRNKLAQMEEGIMPAYIRESFGFDLSCSDEKQIQIYETIVRNIGELTDQGEADYPRYYLESKAAGRADYIAIYGGLFFLGVMLGGIFLFGMILIMYYKQISEGYEDQGRFDILMKVGMSRKEVKKSINSQILTVFFMPLVMAGIHLAFAFPLISKILLLLSATEEKLLIFVTVCCYFVFTVFYVVIYVITSKSYYGIVSGRNKNR